MNKKEYNQISDITYKIQDLADELSKFEDFSSSGDNLHKIARGVQDLRDDIASAQGLIGPNN